MSSELGADPPGTISIPETVIQPYPTIKKGSRGPTVAKWQRMLGITADGNFGSGTDAATKKYQSEHGLTADGVVGVATWAEALKTTSPTGMLALEWNQPSPEIPSPPAPATVIPPVQGAVPLSTAAVAPATGGFSVPSTPAKTPIVQASMLPSLDSLSTPVKIGLGLAAAVAVVMSTKKKHK